MSRFSRARQITDPVEALKTGRGDCPCMKKVLPPIPNVGCVETYLTGEVLRDPGFENQLSVYGTGPNLADDIPHTVNTTTTDLFRWPETADAIFNNDPPLGDDTYWAQDFGNVVDGTNRWLIKTTNPRTGSRHARLVSPTQAIPSQVRLLYAVRQARCDKPAGGSWGTTQDWWTARAKGGDLVTVSIWAMVNSASLNASLEIGIAGVSPTYGGGQTFHSSPTFALTTSYVQYSTSVIVDSADYAVQVYFGPVKDSGGTITFDLDDASVTIS